MDTITIEDLEAMEKETITPAIAASVLNCNQQSIRIAARTEPESLGFPVVLIGSRVKIPRRAFIQFMMDGGPWFARGRK